VETKVNNNPSKDSYKTVYSQPFSPTLSILGWGFLFYNIFIIKIKMEINKLITEELEKFKLFSKYSPEKTLTENEIVLMEQTKTIPQQAYELMIKGAKGNFGMGTLEEPIKNGINMLNSADDFYAMNDLFKDKKTGYVSFQDMIKGEFEFGGIKDFSNEDDLREIADKLKELDVPHSYGKNDKPQDFTVGPKPEPVANAETPSNADAVTDGEKKERQQHINGMYCSVKNGVISSPGSVWDEDKWENYVSRENVTVAEIEEAKKTCPNRDNPAETLKEPETNTQKKLKWNPEEFPLQYMDQGPNVKRLQQALDVRNKAGKPNITGKFYNATQAALDKKAKELGLSYDRNQGLTKDDFNKIIAARETYSSGGATDFDDYESLSKKDQQQNVQTNNTEKRPDDMPGEPKNPVTDVKNDDVNSTGY